MRVEIVTVVVMAAALAGCATEPTVPSDANKLVFAGQPANAAAA